MIRGRVAVILGRGNTQVTVILGNAQANLGNAGLPLALTDTAHPHLAGWLVGYNGKARGGRPDKKWGCFASRASDFLLQIRSP